MNNKIEYFMKERQILIAKQKDLMWCMKIIKAISIFLIFSFVIFLVGFCVGVEASRFFYPGEWKMQAQNAKMEMEETEEIMSVISANETLCADTKYILKETDLLENTSVETVQKLPNKYIGMNREQFIEAMEVYETSPPLMELERGFVNLEVLSFSRERVVVQMNYQYVQPSKSFYLAVIEGEIVVYLEDMETIYIYTGIELETLPENLQLDIINTLWISDEESLYDFLETHSS